MSRNDLSRRALIAGVAAFAPTAAAALPSLPLVPLPDDLTGDAAVLARAEQTIDLLRTCYVCEGWKLDEEAASHTLDYFRRMAAGAPEDDDGFNIAREFIRRHGQSLDWILFGDPGVMICHGAARSARAAAGASDDPIFALIEKHRRLQAEAIALSDAQNELEESLPDDVTREPRVSMYPKHAGGAFTRVEKTDDHELLQYQRGALTDELYQAVSLADLTRNASTIPEEHRDAWLADREAAFRRDRRALRRRQRKAGLTQIKKRAAAALNAEYAAGLELISTAPTTPAGVAAIARYCVEWMPLGPLFTT